MVVFFVFFIFLLFCIFGSYSFFSAVCCFMVASSMGLCLSGNREIKYDDNDDDDDDDIYRLLEL